MILLLLRIRLLLLFSKYFQLPTKAILQGDDPYHTELNQGPANRNYELLGAGENVPEAQALSADPVSPDHTDTSITLPAPKPITIPVPEFIHL